MPERIVALLLALALLLAGCGAAPANPTPARVSATVVPTAHGQYYNVAVAEFAAMLAHKDFFLVDVHVPPQGRMPELDARIPYDQIAANLDKLPADRAARIVLVCQSGGMSKMAAATLADLGYSNVYNLVGGYNAWRAAGYPFTPEPVATEGVDQSQARKE